MASAVGHSTLGMVVRPLIDVGGSSAVLGALLVIVRYRTAQSRVQSGTSLVILKLVVRKKVLAGQEGGRARKPTQRQLAA